MTNYLNPSEACINRKSSEGVLPERAELSSIGGDVKFVFPNHMTDEQIMIALMFANQAHSAGVTFPPKTEPLQT